MDILSLYIDEDEDHMMYGSRDIRHDRQSFSSFWAFYPPDNPENQNFDKNEKNKTAGDIIILHKCTTNDNHMMYGS